MKKIIVVICIFLIGVLVYITVTEVNSKDDSLYTDNTQQSSLDNALCSLVAESDLNLRLPSGKSDIVLDKVTTGKTTYHLVLLPYKNSSDQFAGFVMRTEEHNGKWKTDRLTAFYKVNTKDKDTLTEAIYIYSNVTDSDSNKKIYFALGKAPDDTNATALGELIKPCTNGAFGVISLEDFSIYQ